MSKLGGTKVSEDTDKDANTHLLSVVAGTGIDSIDSSDPVNPIINATVGTGASSAKVSLTADITGRGVTLADVDWTSEVYDDNSYFTATSEKLIVPAGVTRVNLSANLFFNNVTAGVVGKVFVQRFSAADAFIDSVAVVYQTAAAGNTNIAVSASVLGTVCVAGEYFKVRTAVNDAAHDIDTISTFTIQDVTP